MRRPFLLLLPLLLPAALLVACPRVEHKAPQAKLKAAEEQLAAAADEEARFVALGRPARLHVDFGNAEVARRYANELLDLAPKFRTSWNHGNAIHHGNLVLGRLALKAGDRASAVQYLLLAGGTHGSPQLDTFGPNMTLARDLLAQGEKEAVLRFFIQCKAFWKLHDGQLDRWAADVRSGRQPDFGAHALH